ncbi:MAG: AarF/ABC1/UbiB kinase family protein [Myxococcales bacterium]|nr:AarF/ABC1/UbiB kinase family protein [Myxococcales bacterium]MCB9645918.1 AarF/ABC1/UbiB kinase family protein [Deltaproteobacteria bacterium]
MSDGRDPRGPGSGAIPEHLRSILGEGLSERATEAVTKALSGQTERISTSRVGRALKMSSFAMKSGSRLLMDRAREAMRRTDDPDPGRGVELAAQMLQTFSELRGISMKLGQMLSYLDDALPPEARKILTVLQRDAAPMPWETVRQQLEAELGAPVAELFQHIDESPMAAASIGQVHRAITKEGVEVAVKIQYPGIADAMSADLKNARVLGLFQRMFFFSTDSKAILGELETRFMDECDYGKEAEYQRAYATRFAGHPWAVVPEVHAALSTKKVLTTTFYRGRTFYQWLADDPSPEARERVTRLFYRFYIGSFYLDGLFNCDPHPGNYLFLDDGRVVFLDYGCSRRFEPERLADWIRLCQAVFVDDRAEIERLAVGMGFVTAEQKYDYEAFRSLLRYLYLPYLKAGPFDFAEHRPEDTFRRMFLDNPNLLKLNMPADAVFLNRIGFGLVSLLAEIGCALDCRKQATHYFVGEDLDWPEDPFRGKVPFEPDDVVRPEVRATL